MLRLGAGGKAKHRSVRWSSDDGHSFPSLWPRRARRAERDPSPRPHPACSVFSPFPSQRRRSTLASATHVEASLCGGRSVLFVSCTIVGRRARLRRVLAGAPGPSPGPRHAQVLVQNTSGTARPARGAPLAHAPRGSPTREEPAHSARSPLPPLPSCHPDSAWGTDVRIPETSRFTAAASCVC